MNSFISYSREIIASRKDVLNVKRLNLIFLIFAFLIIKDNYVFLFVT